MEYPEQTLEVWLKNTTDNIISSHMSDTVDTANQHDGNAYTSTLTMITYFVSIIRNNH